MIHIYFRSHLFSLYIQAPCSTVFRLFYFILQLLPSPLFVINNLLALFIFMSLSSHCRFAIFIFIFNISYIVIITLTIQLLSLSLYIFRGP